MEYKAKCDVICEFFDTSYVVHEDEILTIDSIVSNKRGKFVNAFIYNFSPTIKTKFVRIDFEIFKFAFEKVEVKKNVNA